MQRQCDCYNRASLSPLSTIAIYMKHLALKISPIGFALVYTIRKEIFVTCFMKHKIKNQHRN